MADEMKWREFDYNNRASWPEAGWYAVRIAGDSESEDGHVLYSYPDYTTFAKIEYDEGDGSLLFNAQHDEEPDFAFAVYGPLDVPEYDQTRVVPAPPKTEN